MTAKEAFKMTVENVCKNEDRILMQIRGWEAKVAESSDKGETMATLGVFSNTDIPYVLAFFEGLGYYVSHQGINPNERIVFIDWHIIPYGSRWIVRNSDVINAMLLANEAGLSPSS